MKLASTQSRRFLGSVLILMLFGVQLCSSTLLAGTMFYALMGNYFTRTVFPNAIGSLFRTMVNSPQTVHSEKQTVNHYIISPPQNSNNGSQQQVAPAIIPVIRSDREPSTLESMVKLAQALGLDKRMDSYVKEAWPELKCSVADCDKKGNIKKKKKQSETTKKTRKADTEEDDDDSDENDLSKPTLTASEEMAGYKIFGEDDDDILTQADEELADEDPFNFYFILQDQKRKAEREKLAAEFAEGNLRRGPNLFRRDSDETSGPHPYDSRNPPPPPAFRGAKPPDFHHKPPPPPPEFNNNRPPPHHENDPSSYPPGPPPPPHLSSSPFPLPKRAGIFPIFIRYKVKAKQQPPGPDNANSNMPPPPPPMMHPDDPKNNFNFRFGRRAGQPQMQMKHNQKPQRKNRSNINAPNPNNHKNGNPNRRPLPLLSALNRVAANVLQQRVLVPINSD